MFGAGLLGGPPEFVGLFAGLRAPVSIVARRRCPNSIVGNMFLATPCHPTRPPVSEPLGTAFGFASQKRPAVWFPECRPLRQW